MLFLSRISGDNSFQVNLPCGIRQGLGLIFQFDLENSPGGLDHLGYPLKVRLGHIILMERNINSILENRTLVNALN